MTHTDLTTFRTPDGRVSRAGLGGRANGDLGDLGDAEKEWRRAACLADGEVGRTELTMFVSFFACLLHALDWRSGPPG